MSNYLIQYYRCPEHYVRLALKGALSTTSGYFRFGENTICYGRYCGRRPSASPAEALADAHADIRLENGTAFLPFDLAQVADNLRHELYAANGNGPYLQSLMKRMYYCVRPLLPVGVRKHLQRIHLNGWQHARFPHWPVDRSVDSMFEQLLLLALRAQGVARIPFVWFWPEGAASCAFMTHDVETARGKDFCATLMDIDDSFGIKASFQIVPECRYEVTPAYLDSIRKRGFEIALQDLNHDGHLFRNRREFRARAARINAYGRQWGTRGFRTAVLYRRQEWFDDLEFSYDMSVPNVAHLDPQRGGCCTIMPYFIGNLLELPVTTTQDYSLFHILNDYSIDLWKRQTALIMQKHGLVSFIIHPDYITSNRERHIYEALLAHLSALRAENGLWVTTPAEVNRWWRQRMEMRIIEDGDHLRIDGPGKERGRIAYASEQDGRLVFTLNEAPANESAGLRTEQVFEEPRTRSLSDSTGFSGTLQEILGLNRAL